MVKTTIQWKIMVTISLFFGLMAATPSIAWFPSTPPSGIVLENNSYTAYFSHNSTIASSFQNTTCFMNYTDGTVYMSGTSILWNETNITFNNLTTKQQYKISCTIFENTTQASTGIRDFIVWEQSQNASYAFLGLIIVGGGLMVLSTSGGDDDG